MKYLFLLAAFFNSCAAMAQTGSAKTGKELNLYLDIHRLPSGKATFEETETVHLKDLAFQEKFGVRFLKYWVDEKNGIVYCLSLAKDSSAVKRTHSRAHGLMPAEVLLVKAGTEALSTNDLPYFLDIHQLGAGKVTAQDVEAAHVKDLAVQEKHGVNFINYWVDEKNGTVLCLSQAADASHVTDTHREAHGLLPAYIERVEQGQ